MKLPVRIKKLNEKAVLPKYATDGSAGMDLTATSEKIVIDGGNTYVEYGTSLAFEIPKGFVALLFPRSSISSNTTLSLSNSVGVLDSDYRGEVTFRFRNLSFGAGKKYKIGDRIGQILVIPYPSIEFEEVSELNDTDRGSGGYGSSGK
jgi:dUTP pyrophosphatase